ncbi:MAG: hypothetical protein OEV68_05265, partial [candidate division Zixibacteria bacterium]|nr:hypothetical protein [candidate division Zixibacteria bacterium]MDH4032575.1 hypothetical protein [candidate division Zixibacteria bacterium]
GSHALRARLHGTAPRAFRGGWDSADRENHLPINGSHALRARLHGTAPRAFRGGCDSVVFL